MTRWWGEGVKVEGGSLGKWGGDSGNSSQLQWQCRKTTPFGCPGEERRG
jgi:hypothetical protein